MATNKKTSTSKTARVMNLLSKNREEPMESEAVTESAPAPAPAPVAAPAAPAPAPSQEAAVPVSEPQPVAHTATRPIISSMQADSAISNQVMSALEDALDDELRLCAAEEVLPVEKEVPENEAVSAPAAPAPMPETETVLAPEEETAVDAVNDAVAEAIAQITEAEEAVVEASESAMIHIVDIKDEQPHPPTQYPVDQSTIYVNVMEALVEDKAMKYIDMFGLCKCPRCVADVKAYALNHLDPKYVVMHTGEVIPRITLYEGRFSAAVTAQLLTACKLVMEHPRHDR